MPTPSPKFDTVFQSDDGGTPDSWSSLARDESQNNDDLVEETDWAYELGANAARFTNEEINVTIRFDHNTNDSGFLYNRRSGSSNIQGLRANASSVTLFIDGSQVLEVDIPGSLPSSGGDDIVISYSARPNPLTTGSSDAYYNEIRMWNETDDAVSGGSVTSTAPDVSDVDIIFGARGTPGGVDYTGEVIDIAYSDKFHSTEETYTNWIATPSSEAETAEAPIEVPFPPTDTLDASDEIAGPVYTLGAASAVRNGLMTASPQVNSLPMSSLPDFFEGTEPTPARWRSDNVPTSDGNTWHWIGQYTWYPPVGLNVNRFYCRVHLQAFDSGTDGPYETFIRVYSMNAHPDSLELALPQEDEDDAIEYFFAGASSTTDHGSSDTGGEWLEIGDIKIARAPGEQHTMIGVAARIGTGTTPSEHRWRLRAVTVEPMTTAATNPGDADGLAGG